MKVLFGEMIRRLLDVGYTPIQRGHVLGSIRPAQLVAPRLQEFLHQRDDQAVSLELVRFSLAVLVKQLRQRLGLLDVAKHLPDLIGAEVVSRYL